AAAKPSHRRPELTNVEKQHLRGLLCGYSPAEIAEKRFCSRRSVEVDLSNTIYRYVEVLTEHPTNALDNWRTVAVWLEAQGYKTQGYKTQGYKTQSTGAGERSTAISSQPTANLQLLDWGEAPDVSTFFGRELELATLHQWLVADRCRLIAVLGIWGIGKTTLVARLADQVKTEFDCLIWRSLLSPMPFELILADWLQQLSTYMAIEVPDDVDGQISCLLQIFHRHRCCVILDGLEPILQSGDFAGHYHTEYRGYGELLKRVGQTRHQSCLLLTSREKPPEVAILEGDTMPVRSLRLNGLDREPAQKLLQVKGLLKEEQWHKLIAFYRGNPLVLNIVATTIQDLFGGDVNAFLQQSPTYVTRDLSRFLQQQLDRLSLIEQQIMCKLAQAQEPMTLSELEASLHPISPYELFQALEALNMRSLIERTAQGFTLQPVIAEYLRKDNEYCKRFESHPDC
ncbi:MAG TPA: NB-ARC domain-containing protein, partial [Allocoleopsis sp.]